MCVCVCVCMYVCECTYVYGCMNVFLFSSLQEQNKIDRTEVEFIARLSSPQTLP